MEDSYVISYDIGTGGAKAVLVTAAASVVATEFEPYPVSYPRYDWAEQNPLDWWNAICAATQRLLTKTGIEKEKVIGIVFASQMLGVLPVDAHGNPLRPAIIWMDCRAQIQADRLVRMLGGKKIVMSLVGAVPSGKDVICKLKWLRENETQLFKDTHVFL
ncbi:MAG: FGGY family carbohydrate kinase, partial [Smithellaceae bacterium]|nr:FGGY family carbohydrate kinase [Smithellaceae bacterium]